MDRGTYSAASAGLFQFRKLEVVNNNLANINTPGFKKQLIAGELQTFDQTLASKIAGTDPFAQGDHDRTPAVVNLQTVTDFSPGPVKNTGNPLDAALRDPHDFFVVQTPGGQQYTRAGNFTLDQAGELVTQDGFPILGDGGAVTLDGPGASIGSDGSVLVNGQAAGRVSVVRFENPDDLERVGSTRFAIKPGRGQPNEVEAELIPESLEMSNVSAISNVVDLMVTQRAFQAYTKSSETIDTMNQIAISQVGRARG